MEKKRLTSSWLFPLILIAGITLTSCSNGGGATSPANSAPPIAASPATPKTGFDADLDYVRKGQYTYVWVFSREDGKPLDKEDAAFLRKTAPQVVDWVTSEGGTKVIAGTNFDLEQGNLELLRRRFVAEDYTAR